MISLALQVFVNKSKYWANFELIMLLDEQLMEHQHIIINPEGNTCD